MDLHIELIPQPCWFINLRTQVSKKDWDKIRHGVYDQQKMICAKCHEKKEVLEAHEVWNYDEKAHVQKLVDIIGVCKKCHCVIHFGRTQMMGYGQDAIQHYLDVNHATMVDFEIERLQAQEKWLRRNKITDWKLDVSFVENQGIVVKTNCP